MAEERRTSFDFRDQDMRGEQFQPTRAPSAAATDLRNTTRSALAGGGSRANSMVNPFTQPNPYPNTRSAPQAPDRSGPNITYIGGNPNDPVAQSKEATSDLFARARGTNNLADRSALLREAIASSQFDRSALDAATTTGEGAARRQSAADLANLNAQVDTNLGDQRERTALQLGAQDSADTRYGVDTRDSRSRLNAELSADTSRANNADTLLQRGLSDQQDRRLQEERLTQGRVGTYTLADHQASSAIGDFNNNPAAERQSLEAALYGTNNPGEQRLIKERILALDEQIANPQPYANGGLVRGYAEGGIVAPGAGAPAPLGAVTPQLPDPALIDKYTQYATGAEAMGLNTIGFEQFAQMAQGAQATAGTAPPPSGAGAPTDLSGAGAPVALAEGGEVPAAGKMVIDSDPNAPQDSIPAVIDGQTPAALDSGELVFPRHAVLYFGTDKLNKMIAKSKEAQEGGNGESATGLNG